MLFTDYKARPAILKEKYQPKTHKLHYINPPQGDNFGVKRMKVFSTPQH